MTLTAKSHSVKQSSGLQQLVSGRQSGPGTGVKTEQMFPWSFTFINCSF